MRSYFDTPEYQRLQHQRTALMNSCGNLRRGDDPEVRLIDQRIADNRWHHENPGLTGSWRIGYRDGKVVEAGAPPRFETEAAAAAFIASMGDLERAYLVPVFLRSRQTIESDRLAAAGYSEAA